jgi:chromosome segregation ATPase
MKKSELKAFIKEEIKSTLTTEGVWSKGDDTAIRDFILDVEQLKDDYYNIVGSDDVFNGLDAAINAANELIAMKEATYKVSADKVDSIKDKVSDEDTVEVTEEEDKEPSKADLKATKGLAKAKEELAQLTQQMKSLARDYKKAEGAEKEKIVADLKKKTKLKKELEAIIDK